MKSQNSADWKREYQIDDLQQTARLWSKRATENAGNWEGEDYARRLTDVNAEIEALGGTPQYPNLPEGFTLRFLVRPIR